MSKEKKAREVADTPEENTDIPATESGVSAEEGSETEPDFDENQETLDEEEPSAEDQIASLNEEVQDLKDQLLRKQADFENFRKRMIRDREDAIRYGNTNLLLDLVEIIDNFERAIKSAQESKDFDTFHTGVEMIEKQFTGMLDNKYGLKRFESVGEEFDPEKHEAIAAIESDDVESQTVIDDFQKGYMLHDRVLRHAKVRVAMPVSDSPADSEDQQDNVSDH